MTTEATRCLSLTIPSLSKRGMHERGMVVLGDAEQPLCRSRNAHAMPA